MRKTRAHPLRSSTPARSTALALALTGVTTVLLSGCSVTQEAICRSGEYPALNVGSTGSACVADQQQPPQGFVRYPADKTPQHTGDEWDVFWNTHTIDEHGATVEAPAP